MSAALAAQAPAWTPGTRHGYHAVTLGWYESELIRHADPLGRSLGQFFAEEIAKPLGLDFYIGLPASVDRDRVAHLHGCPGPRCCGTSTRYAATFCGGLLNPSAWQREHLPIANGIGDLDALTVKNYAWSRYPPPTASVPRGRWPKPTAASRQVVLSSA